PQKINAAYALGGPALAIKTVQAFMGNDLKINHIVEVNFTNFPKLINALGGIDITLKKCVSSNRFSGTRVRLKQGEHHLSLEEESALDSDFSLADDDSDESLEEELAPRLFLP